MSGIDSTDTNTNVDANVDTNVDTNATDKMTNNEATGSANQLKGEAVKSTSEIIKKFLASVFGFTKNIPTVGIQPGEAKRKRGLGDKDYISYKYPWILYFYPDPKADPNYVLLDPENDKILLNKVKGQILQLITFMVLIGILYTWWKTGMLFPAIHTSWFFFWRYMSLSIFFLCFMIVIAIMRGFPFFLRKISHYAELTINPYKDPKAYRVCHKYTVNFRWFFYGGYTIAFALATILWTFLFICILVPLFAIFATLCGLLLGNLNTKYFAFGMAEYEVTELDKKPMQKRMENSLGITRAKAGISAGLEYLEGKTGIGKGLSTLKSKMPSTDNPFLKYKMPESTPEIKKLI
jgi:hypothetical protein